MSKREYILRYLLIIRKLRNSRKASFKEINFYLETESEIQGHNLLISKRTFQRDLNDIRTLFGIDIKCDHPDNKYFISDEDDEDLNIRLLAAFELFDSLCSFGRISDYIHFEKRRSQGTEHISGLLHSINNRLKVKYIYQKYWGDEYTERYVCPIAIKESKSRWYLIAIDSSKNEIKTFGLDRISQLIITSDKFIYPKHFNVNEYFKYSFGIISDMSKPEEVILSFIPQQGKYIKSFPLHEFQQIIIDNELEFRIKLKILITYDFIIELLSFGENMKVIKPESLIKEIKDILNATIKQYDNDN